MKLAADMWVATLDGAKAIIMVNIGTAFEPRLKVLKTVHQENPPTHEQGRDRPGRMNDTSGPHKSSMEAPDLHQRAEDAFIADVMLQLEREAEQGAFEKIVLVAPPVALGTVRKEIGAHLRPRIVKEISADYVKMPTPDIAHAVQKALEA
ncbi:MAG: host attachment protein [Hyphomicrobiaceae bacterium]|nr:host attachment protein [Hyphomicrobiaceae bacterium]MCC0008258.1 host attachment protein [Hyphomicrobiaceae bacterium]